MSETNVENSASGIEAKITGFNEKIISRVDKTLGYITDHPWADWFKTGEKYILRYLPIAVAALGVLTLVSFLVVSFCADIGIATVAKVLLGLAIAIAFVLYLLPKTTTLVTSLLDNREDEAVRPQILGVMKTGGLLFAASLLLNPESDFVAAIIVLILSLILVVLATNPKIMGVKAECPQNYAEELITLCLLPYKVLAAFFTYIIAGLVLGGLIVGMSELFGSGFESVEAIVTLSGTLIFVVALPLIVYFMYLFVNFFAEIIRAIVSIPKKLDELRNK